MTHEILHLNFTGERARELANLEPESGIVSVGGLATRMNASNEIGGSVSETIADRSPKSADPRRQSLGKFIELSRRRMRLSVEELADQASIDLAELLSIERGDDAGLDARTVHRLAQFLQIRPEPLLELAGLSVTKSAGLAESAMRFAARSEPMDELTKQEEEALNWFKNELSK